MLMNRKNLAIKSSTPGRTRLINFFRLELKSSKETVFEKTEYSEGGSCEKCHKATLGRAEKTTNICELCSHSMGFLGARPQLHGDTFQQLPPHSLFLVDLPGYGFAKASKHIATGWGENLGEYLKKSEHLRRVFVLLDIRHKPSNEDELMLHFLQQHGIPFTLIATKADKISRSESHTLATKLASHLGIGRDDIIISSAKDRKGHNEIWAKIAS